MRIRIIWDVYEKTSGNCYILTDIKNFKKAK